MDAEFPRGFGPYVLLSSLGKGAAGEAFLARPYDDQRGIPAPVVIKVLHQKLADSEEFVKRFRHEAEVAVRVTSPHIAAVYDVGAVGDTLYIAMDYVSGVTGSKLFHRVLKRRKEVPLAVASGYVVQGLRGLSDLFNARGREGDVLEVIHRDVSPKNIMLGDDGLVRLIDLGLGKSKAQDWQTRDGRVMGSPGYMAPEQIVGEKADHRSDLFALGVVFHELLVGRRWLKIEDPLAMLRAGLTTPLERPSLHRTDLPEGLDALVAKATAPDREYRFASADAFADALEALVPPAPPEEIAAFAHGVMGAEVLVRKAEVNKLLSLTFAPPDEPEIEKTMVLAVRAGVTQAVDPTQLVSSGSLPPISHTSAGASGDEWRMQSALSPPSRSPLPLVALGVGALMLVTMVMVLMRQTPAPERPVPQPVVARKNEPVVATRKAEPAVVQRVRAAEPKKKETPAAPAKRRSRVRKATPEPPPTPPASPPPAVNETRDPKAELVRIKKRVAQLRSSLDRSDPRFSKVLTLQGDVSADLQVFEKLDDKTARVAKFNKRLRALER